MAIDPDFHNPDLSKRQGTVLNRRTAVSGKWQSIYVDTNALTVGTHKLFLRASDANYTSVGTMQTALVLEFEVVR